MNEFVSVGVSKTHKRASVGAFEELDTNSGLTNCQEVSAALVNGTFTHIVIYRILKTETITNCIIFHF